MSTRTADRLFAACLLILAVYIVWNALDYGYMRGETPGPGFFPLWVGLGLAVLSVVNIVRSVIGMERLESVFDTTGLLKTLGILAVGTVFILITPWLGMLPASGLILPAAAFIIRPRWTRTFTAVIVALMLTFPVLCYFLFVVYLRVPVERGVFGL